MKKFTFSCSGQERELLVPDGMQRGELLAAVKHLFQEEVPTHAVLDFTADGTPVALCSSLPDGQRLNLIVTGAALPYFKLAHQSHDLAHEMRTWRALTRHKESQDRGMACHAGTYMCSTRKQVAGRRVAAANEV